MAITFPNSSFALRLDPEAESLAVVEFLDHGRVVRTEAVRLGRGMLTIARVVAGLQPVPANMLADKLPETVFWDALYQSARGLYITLGENWRSDVKAAVQAAGLQPLPKPVKAKEDADRRVWLVYVPPVQPPLLQERGETWAG